jgi:cytochrome c5
MSIRLWTVAIGLAALATVGCGTRVGKSNGGGGNTGPTPLVVITPIGHKSASAAGANPVTLTVRSGADVTLSGKDSDGGSVALKTFQWSQSGGAVTLPQPPDPGALLYRTANTVSFRAPRVATATKLSFTLLVTNALGGTGSGTADVTVVPADDSNQFLSPPTKPRRFEIGVATVDGLDKTTLSGDVPLCVRVGRQVRYASRDGVTHPPVSLPQLPELQADTSWSASVNAAAAKDSGTSTLTDSSVALAMKDFSNPRVTFDVPSFNDEDLFAMFNQPTGSTSARLPLQLVPSDVDSARLLLSVSAAPGSCDGTRAAPPLATKLVVAVLDVNQQTPLWTSAAANNSPALLATDKSAADLTSDTLLASVTTQGQIETAESARAYYLAIDPQQKKTTLNDWLDANCFDHKAVDYGVAAAGANGAHAVYTNNFDLGFGRDMYFMKCAASNTLASVVVNYPSLELAALKQGPIIAVAMEYGAAADGSKPDHNFAKFYVFAPDDRDGLLKRVASANFDRRGQKYVPGACTSCHGGTLPTLPANFASATMTYPVIQDPQKDSQAAPANACGPTTPSACLSPGDVDAAFMPWDLDSLLYADTDPAFTGISIPKKGYTRPEQEAGLKALNVLVHEAFQPQMEPQRIPDGHGGTTTVQVDRYANLRSLVEWWYGGANFPNASYKDATPPDTWTSWSAPSAAADLYHNVFARNCRACHTANPAVAIQFSGPNGYTDFVNEFVATNTTTPAGGSGGQHIGRQYVFQQGVMPRARLTMDRFWVNYGGGDSPAKALAAHLSQAIGATDLLTGSGDAVAPGQPTLSVKVNGSTADATTGLFTAQRFKGARIESSASFFVASYTWTVCVSATQGGACVPAPIVGSTTAAPGIDTAAYGYYTLKLVADNGLGQTVSQTYTIFVPDSVPTPVSAGTCPAGKSAPFIPGASGTAVPLAVAGCFSPPGDPPYILTISTDGNVYSPAPIADPTLPWNASVVPGANPGISFNFTANASGAGNNTIYYKWCDFDSECALGTTTVALTGSLQASSTPIVAYYDPALNPDNTTRADLLVPSTGQPIHFTTPADSVNPFASLRVLQDDMSLGVPANSAVSLSLSLAPSARGTLSATQLDGTSVADLRSKISALRFTPAPAAVDHCVNLDVHGQPLAAGLGVCTDAANVSNQLSSPVVTPTPAARIAPVKVQAVASYSQAASPTQESVYAVMTETGSCANGGCHQLGNAGTGATWFVTGSGTAGYLDDTFTSARTNIVPGSPDTSLFYTAACQTGFGTMVRAFAPGSAQCHILYQWILEGAPKD